MFKLMLLVVVSIVGYVQGTWDNAEPFIDPSKLLLHGGLLGAKWLQTCRSAGIGSGGRCCHMRIHDSHPSCMQTLAPMAYSWVPLFCTSPTSVSSSSLVARPHGGEQEGLRAICCRPILLSTAAPLRPPDLLEPPLRLSVVALAGFDAISNAAEEVRCFEWWRLPLAGLQAHLAALPCSPTHPPALPRSLPCQTRDVKHMPWAIVGTPLAAMVMYVMLAFALVMITYPNPRAALPWNPSLGRDGPGQGLPFGPYPGVSFPALDTCNGPQLTFTIAFVELQGAWGPCGVIWRVGLQAAAVPAGDAGRCACHSVPLACISARGTPLHLCIEVEASFHVDPQAI